MILSLPNLKNRMKELSLNPIDYSGLTGLFKQEEPGSEASINFEQGFQHLKQLRSDLPSDLFAFWNQGNGANGRTRPLPDL
jgi:hypothetical protein